MIAEAIASAELAQQAWTYPICRECGASILRPSDAWITTDFGAPLVHAICPAVEDLDTLPLVERAAIACSIIACRGVDDGLIRWGEVDDYFGDDVAFLTGSALVPGRAGSVVNSAALASSMLFNHEVAS